MSVTRLVSYTTVIALCITAGVVGAHAFQAGAATRCPSTATVTKSGGALTIPCVGVLLRSILDTQHQDEIAIGELSGQISDLQTTPSTTTTVVSAAPSGTSSLSLAVASLQEELAHICQYGRLVADIYQPSAATPVTAQTVFCNG